MGRSLPCQAPSGPAVLTEPRGSLDCLKCFQMSPERHVEDKPPQTCTCKNSPGLTAAHEQGGSRSRWPRLSDSAVPGAAPLCFPSISSPGAQFWQAAGPLESTVSFKVIPEQHSQPPCHAALETRSYKQEPRPKQARDLVRLLWNLNKVPSSMTNVPSNLKTGNWTRLKVKTYLGNVICRLPAEQLGCIRVLC